jgi:AraC-type DNA-binding domain-containing proteins
MTFSLEEFYIFSKIPISIYDSNSKLVEQYPLDTPNYISENTILEGISKLKNEEFSFNTVVSSKSGNITNIKYNYYITYIQSLFPELGYIVLGPYCTEQPSERCGSNPYYFHELAVIHASELFRSLFLLKQNAAPTSNNIKNYHVKQFMDYIKHNSHNELSLIYISKALNINPHYLCRVLKKETGKTSSELLATVRIDNAKLLLNDKKLSILDISQMTGYSSQSYFSKQFKQLVGMSPRHFRTCLN